MATIHALPNDLQARNAAIPDELKNLHQWARWIKGTRDKMPANLDGSAMEWSNRDNWLAFDQVSRFGKIGYFHSLESGIIGVDFDGCRNKETGEIHPAVLDLIKDTYAEVSPNEEGVKAYYKGKLPNDKSVKNKKVPWGDPEGHTGIEIYAQKRFFTVTGSIIPGCPSKIIEAPEILNDILVHFAPAPEPPKKKAYNSSLPATGGYWSLGEWKAWCYKYLEIVEEDDDSFIITCPWCGEHTTDGDTARIWYGTPHTFNCFHAHCSSRKWEDVRIKHEPTAYDKHNAWTDTTTYSPGQEHSQNGNGHRQDPIDSLIEEIQQNIQGIWTKPKSDGKRQFIPHKVELEKIIEYLDMNEYGDGKLFAEAFNGLVCYDHSEKSWYVWKEHHWKKDTTGKIKQLVSGYLGSIYLKARGDIHKQMVDIHLEIQQLEKDGGAEGKTIKLKSKLGRLEALMSELEKRAKALRAAKRMNNVLTFAMSEHNVGITGDVWDSDPWLLGIKNGVIDLRTGECRDGYPIDYIRSISPTEWTGLNTPCPRFERFLQEIFEVLPEAQLQKLTDGKYCELPKEEQEHTTAEHREKLIGFLQRLFGYSIAGLSTEAIFPLLYGEEGRNGKDTLFTILKSVLGLAIANAISNDVFISADKGRAAGSATPHLTDLQGKRIVWGSETKQGDRINVSQIKQLTGGGSISARPPYGFQYTFEPTHTLFLMTNYKPHADARDKAFWTRACLIEFNMRFVDKPRKDTNERTKDPTLSRELETEASGILAWLVRGCLDYQQQRLNRPEIVELSTESYRASEDNIQQFIDECCVCRDNASAGAKRLYDAYVAWCKDNNLTNINGRLFGEDMSKRFVRVHKRTGWEYQKIGIRTDEMPPEGPGRDGSKEDCDGSKSAPSQSSESASEDASDTTETIPCDGCDGTFQEVPIYTSRERCIDPFYGKFRHTRHTTSSEDTTKQPVERTESIFMDKNPPVTPVTHPSHSLETFWAVGKQHNYPEIRDLGLKSGLMGWNSFSLSHRLRMPDVIVRLGGVQ